MSLRAAATRFGAGPEEASRTIARFDAGAAVTAAGEPERHEFNKKAFTATVTLSSSPLAARFKFPAPRHAKEGTTATLKAQLTVGGAPVEGQLVSLSLGPGQACGPVFTDPTGLASCTVKLTNVVGTRPFQAYFAGDSAYLAVDMYSTFSVTS